ncbi:MAG: hypothetical protein GWN00_37550 [Aliifodinibius sp.]|nr:hypothetical protein [Fodinibius sp.]NIV16319.1 hypothetical protein [Fodinibius sp.]NIY30286.1 hypothetical protein [Fodinibius sp.]
MIIWIPVALLGLILSSFGITVIFKKYLRDQVRGRYILAIILGFLSFVTYAVLSPVLPDIMSGEATIAMLLPALIALLVVIHEHHKRSIP